MNLISITYYVREKSIVIWRERERERERDEVGPFLCESDMEF